MPAHIAAHVFGFVFELLDVARLQQGQFVLERRPVELGALVTQSVEEFRQNLHSNRPQGDTVIVKRGPGDTTGYKFDVLPSLNVVYALSKSTNLRAAFSKTVSRPEFRELAPFSFYDFTTATSVRGNDTLAQTNIYNADLRFEIFPGVGQMFATTVFYKRFIDAIEQSVSNVSGGGSLSRTFKNADNAENFGLELEARQNLALVDEFLNTTLFQNLTVNFNLSIIRSEVKLDSVSDGGRSSRSLQGQSPYVFNAGLTYLPQSGSFSASALFNVIGRRIQEVGTDKIPDVYEAPRPVLDLQVSKTVLKYGTVKLTVSDLLQRPAVLYQDRDESGTYEPNGVDTRMQLTRSALSCGLSFAYKF